jgi:hypothetical protein
MCLFISLFIHSFIILSYDKSIASCKRFLHTVRSSASSFNYQHPLVSLRSSSSCLRLHPCLPFTSIVPSICPSITCFRRQFLCKIWPIIGLFSVYFIKGFRLLLDCMQHPSFLIKLVQLIFSFLLQHHISYFLKCPSFSTIQSYAPNVAFHWFIP